MNILLGVTGSIACYKSYDLARLLLKKGHSVKVILTNGALEFIKPDTFRYLGVEDVFLPQDDFKINFLKKEQTVLHVELVKWADKLIIAPTSANTLSRLSLGITNDLLTSVFTAFGKKTILLFPAMNTQMWINERIQKHRCQLEELSHIGIINPTSGILACGDIGEGKFPDTNAILDLIECFDPQKKQNKKIIITAGATASPLDPVRYLTNPSSGKMGISIAKAFLASGYEVVVLAGHACTQEVHHLSGHPRMTIVNTPTTELMKEAALDLFPSSDLYISTGAIADIEFDFSQEKLKKEQLGNTLSFKKAADILKEVLKIKINQKVISFAAETETTHEVFLEKMARKPVDLMIGNKVSSGLIDGKNVEGFQKDSGSYFFVTPESIKGPVNLTKLELGKMLVNWFEGKTPW